MGIIISGETGIDLSNTPIQNASQVECQDKQLTPYSGFKNYIINGNFDITQRGDTYTLVNIAAGVYHLDRWCSTQFGFGGTQSVQKVYATVNGANDVALRTSQVTACNNKIVQILENDFSKSLRGKKMTVSFWYRAKGNISCRLQQRTDRQTLNSDFTTVLSEDIGTAIGESSGLIADETWRYSSFTTSTSSGNGYFHLLFNQDIAAGNYYELSKVQLEEGSVATPFENRPIGLELSLCQRYYEVQYVNQNGGYYVGVQALNPIQWSTQKRVVPTINFSSISYSNCNSLIVNIATQYSLTPQITSTNLLNGLNYIVTASAEL